MKFLKYTEFLNEASIESVISKLGQLDNIKVDSLDDYINHFVDLGAKRIAGGASAEVFDYDGHVVKIYYPNNDSAMTRYLSFCESNKNNPFVPKISKILKVWASEDNRWVFAIFMEKLEVASSEFAKELNEVFYETKVFKFGVVKKDDKEFFKKIASVILRYSKIGLEKELDVIISFLRSGITKYHYSVDFGPHNWMMRGSQIVLIDPFWPVYEK